MMMRYHTGLGVGHTYSHSQDSSHADQSTGEEPDDTHASDLHGQDSIHTNQATGEESDDPRVDLQNEDPVFWANAAVDHRDEELLEDDERGEEDEDEDEEMDVDRDCNVNANDDEELVAMDEMYGG
jgi:hypothetical protein